MLKQFPPQTSFNLNGPHLSFIQNPVGITTENGYPVTLVGIATASFKTGVSTDSPSAPDNPAVSTGSLSYQWYEVGINGAADKKVVDDVDTNNGVITGSGTTTLTIQKVITPQDDGKQYYLTADYVPSTTTGEAHNEPLKSGIGTVTVLSVLEITKQPESASSFNSILSYEATQEPAKFNVGARVSGKNEGEDVTYQWYFDSGTDSYATKPLYRHYNPNSTDHYCSDNPVPATGYHSQGVICQIFIHQAPGTIAIIDAEPDSPTVDRPDTGIIGYAYPSLKAALDEGQTEGSVTAVYNMQKRDWVTQGADAFDTGTDEMWSTSPNEGVTAVWGQMTITPDVVHEDLPTYTWDTSTEEVIKTYNPQGGGGYFRPTVGYPAQGVTYTLKANTNITVDIEAKGAAGGYSPRSRTDGGSGGHSEGKFTFIKNREYLLRIGGKGEFGKLDDNAIGSSENQGGWNGGGNGKGYDRSGGGGGGYTGLFLKSGSLDLWTTTRGVSGYGSWYGVAYGDPSASVAKFVAVGVNRAMYSTDNGITWNSATPAEETEWRSVTWGDDKFVAVAQSGTNRVMYSNDGITWISATAPTDTWQSVTYGNGKYVAVANSSGGTHRAMYSTDGINWNNTTTNTSTFGVYWTSVTYGNGRFVAVGYVGSGSTPKSMRSVDGLTWAEEVLPYGADDPREWRSVTYGVDANGIGKFVAGATDGTKRLMYSYDGSGWTLVESPSGTTSNGWHSMAYGEGRFVAVSSTFDTSNRIIYSNDGISWTKANAVEDPDDDWKSVTYGDGRFVAVSSEQRSDGSGTYVTYSSYTGDGNIRQSNAIIIAAGGGGAANDGAGASAGGGLEGQTLTRAWNRRGGPGTQNNGGEGGGNSQAASAANGWGLTVGEAGSALQGGKGAGGGGGGYYGGGGGVTNIGPGGDGDGGGGSSYLHPDLLTDAITVTAGGGKGSYSDSGQDNADGEFRMEATNYASGSSYHGTWFDGTINDVFDGSTLTNLHGRPHSFSIRFTNLPVPTTSLRFYIVQQTGNCVLETGKYGVEESITCGEFDTRSSAGGYEGNFLGGDYYPACRNAYIRPNGQLDAWGYQMRFNAEVPLKVSAGDLVSILCVLDNPSSPTVYIDLLVQYGGSIVPVAVPFGIAPKYANWDACKNGSWVSANLVDSGVLVGLIARGGYWNDALGLAQMKINGTTIYKGQTYTTKNTSTSTVIAEGSVGINWPAAGSGRTRNSANGEWVTVDSSAWTSQEILSLSWNGGGAGDGCGLYAIEIDGSILGDSGGYVNTGIKFYAPNEAFTTPSSSLLLNDGDLVNKSTTWEFTGAPDEYASYLAAALPLNEEFQFTNQSALISGKPSNSTSHQIGGVEIVDDATISALSGVGNISKFYGSSARKPIGYAQNPSANPSYIKVKTPGRAFGEGDFCIEYWQFVDKYGDFGDPNAVGLDINYPPARDNHTYGNPEFLTPFVRLQENNSTVGTWSSNFFEEDRIRYYEWDATPWLASDTLGYGGKITFKKWQHIAITRRIGKVVVYVDGINTGSFSDPTNYTGTEYAMFANIWRLTEGFYVQDLRIYSGVAKYTENFTPPSQMMIYAIKERKTFTDDGNFLLPSNATNIKLEVAGAKGGDGGSDRDGVGGIGGKGRQGTIILDSSAAAGEEFVVKVGNAGNDGPSCNGQGGSGGDGGGGNGGDAIGCSGFGGGGGGATSVGLVKWGNGFIVAGGGGGAGGGSWERSGDNGADCGAFSASNSSNIAIDPGSAGANADNNGSGGGGGGAGVSGGDGGRGGVDKSHGGGGGQGGTSQYYSVSTTYYLVAMYRDYSAAPLYDHYCTTDPEPAAGFARDGILCRIYKNQAPHTVAIRDNDEPERYDGPIMGYAYPNLQAVYDAGLNEGNVRPIYRLEGKNRWGFYDIMWSIHDDEGSPTYTNTGVKFYAPWAPLTVTGQVGGDTFSVLESETLNDGDGFVHLSYDHTSESEPFISIESSDILNITGSKTPELTLRSNYAADENVYCQVSSPLATNSPLDTNKVTYVNKVVEGFITINSIGGGIIQSSNINLANGDYTIGNLSSDTDKQQVVNYVSFYSSLDDVEIEMDMYGGMGEDGVNSLGGEGGFSRIQFKLERNVEYVIAGLTDDVRAPFLYRGANLMAVVGGGGQGGYESKTGGDGGGVGVRGGNGTKGNDYGAGGDYIEDGNLDVNGTFGSSYFVDLGILQPGDESNNASTLIDTWQNAAGRTIKCTKGPYWISRGYGPCQDMGHVYFIDENGVEPPTNNTNSITRGFKAGYNIMQTGALGRVPSNIKKDWLRYVGTNTMLSYRSNISVSGSGGNGVAGGKGATQNGGGGGGSGYQDGSVTVIHTQQGGSKGKAKVVMRLKKNTLGRIGTIIPASNNPLAPLHKDDQGRILILSALTTGTSFPNQPNYLQARGGSPPPMPGTNSCVTDEKWQYILDLARDGTQDWRLAVCSPDGIFSENNRRKIAGANPRNIWRMMNANRIPLRNSLAHGWVSPYNYKPGWATSYPTQLTLAWDETSGTSITSSDYSLLWWGPGGTGWGYYGLSSNSFFSPTIYGRRSAEWWILPPGVPDF